MLLVLGHCSVSTCDLQKFVFSDEELTWHEAQRYCKEHHSDLLTVYDKEDFKIIRHDFKKKGKDAWIGLQSVSVDAGDWQWSQPGVDKMDAEWAKGEPDNHGGKTIENCVAITSEGLRDVHCSNRCAFLCYNGEDCYL